MQPNVIGTGVVTIDGDDVGNCPSFVFSQDVTTKVRLKAINGVRYPVETVETERRGTLKFTLDAWVDTVIELATDGRAGAEIIFTQMNDIGPTLVWTFTSANILPAAAIPIVNKGDWSQFEFTADVLYDSSASWGSAV